MGGMTVRFQVLTVFEFSNIMLRQMCHSGFFWRCIALQSSFFWAPTKVHRSSYMPWQQSPAASHLCAHSRMLRSIVAGLVPILIVALGHGANPRFTTIATYPSGGVAQYTATADVNGDGKQDVFASNLNGVVSLLLGNGNGSFQSAKTLATFTAGSYPILTADFNRDGKPDLAILVPGKSHVILYLGRGDGTFQAPKTFLTGSNPRYMAVGDVNRDQNPDLLVSTSSSSAGFNFLLGDGKGNLRAPVTVTAKNGAGAGLLTVGDLNRDGNLDVVTCNLGGNAEVFLGNGNGTFREQPSFNDGTPLGGESQLLLADLHGTGKLDLLVGFFGYEGAQGSIFLFPGNGDGTFGSSTELTAGFMPVWLGAADMDGDHKLDLVVGNGFSNSLTVLINRGNGTFNSSPNNYSTGFLPTDQFTATPGLLSVADLNGDGKPDVTLGSESGVNVLMNLGGGILSAPISIEVGEQTAQIFSTDFNGDGHQDLAITTAGITGHAIGDIDVFFGDGKGKIGKQLFGLASGTSIGPLVGGSFNGNGKPGIAAFGYAGEGVFQIYNTGNGTFASGPRVDILNQPPYMCAGDFNRDGYSDLALLDGNEVDIYLNKHNGTYSGPVTFKLGVHPLFLVARDLNNDGKIDLISANHDSNDVSVLLGNGNGTFQLAKHYSAGSQPNIVTTGDFNGDGKIDLAIGGTQVAILLGRGDGTFGSPSTYPAHGAVTFLAQAPLRGNGIEDLLSVSTDITLKSPPPNIYLLSGKGDGSFAAPVAFNGGPNPYWLAVGDFNDDGAVDVVVSTYYASALNVLLNNGGTRIALQTSSGTINVGQSVTLTTTISASVAGLSRPTGTVAFRDGSKTIGTALVANGKAVFTTTQLTAGTHAVTASYGGDTTFNSHVSGAVSVKVN
jgi:hypothetical protein